MASGLVLSASTPSWSWVQGPLLGFDLETTGVNRFADVPVSVAFVYFQEGEPCGCDYMLVDPGRPIPPEATSIHGITDHLVRREGVPLIAAISWVYGALAAAAGVGFPVAGMNLSYDLTVVDRLARRYLGRNLGDLGLLVIDALTIDRGVDRFRKGSVDGHRIGSAVADDGAALVTELVAD